jgi:AraC-like DNA-binding protein
MPIRHDRMGAPRRSPARAFDGRVAIPHAAAPSYPRLTELVLPGTVDDTGRPVPTRQPAYPPGSPPDVVGAAPAPAPRAPRPGPRVGFTGIDPAADAPSGDTPQVPKSPSCYACSAPSGTPRPTRTCSAPTGHTRGATPHPGEDHLPRLRRPQPRPRHPRSRSRVGADATSALVVRSGRGQGFAVRVVLWPGSSARTLHSVEDRTAAGIGARPAPALRRYVDSYVGFDLRRFPAGVHCGPPSRALTAVISLSDPLEVAAGVDDGSPVTRFDSVAAGLRCRSVAIHHDGRQQGVQMSLTPLGARALYGMPAAVLAHRLVPLDEPLGPLGVELVDRLRAAPTWAARFTALDELLLRAVGRGAGGDRMRHMRPEVAETWRRLVAARGRVQVGAVAAELGWSRRHLTERFREELGLSPKSLARVLRFEHAHELATARDPLPWADVATVSGYADQAHLVRDWSEFTGRTPTGWRRGEVLLGIG